jgi:hypothetical protein
MQAYKGRGVLVPLILYLVTAIDGGEWPNSSPDHFTPGEKTQYPLNMRLGGAQNQCGQKEEKYLFPLPGFEPRIIYHYTD